MVMLGRARDSVGCHVRRGMLMWAGKGGGRGRAGGEGRVKEGKGRKAAGREGGGGWRKLPREPLLLFTFLGSGIYC